MEDLQMLTREETAELFSISLSTLDMWRETGALKPIKTGRNYMYSQEAIKKFQEKYGGYEMDNLVHVNETLEKIRLIENEEKEKASKVRENKLSFASRRKIQNKNKILQMVLENDKEERTLFLKSNAKIAKEINCSAESVSNYIRELIKEGKLYKEVFVEEDTSITRRALSTEPFDFE